jgi:S-adenosylmethionine:tRNA ribosyltransferase-isomerase
MPEALLDFALAPELEAHEPPEARGLRRDQVRLLVTYRDMDRIVHTRFRELPRFLAPGDLVVVNDSCTLPAELAARRADGTEFPLRLSTRLDNRQWALEPRDIKPSPGEIITLPGGASARLLGAYGSSARLWVAELDFPAPFPEYLLQWGRPIRYSYVPEPWPLEMYETVYCGELGSAEMPSAGRPFTWEVIDRLVRKGVRFARLTLHTGVSSLEGQESPYEETYRVPRSTAEAVNATRQAGGRVIAVGTTVVRALESAADEDGRVRPSEGRTDLVITPERGVRVVGGLLTGFHEPRATHLAMLEAIAGKAHVQKAYQAAIEGRYLWHEFGDVHLIL